MDNTYSSGKDDANEGSNSSENKDGEQEKQAQTAEKSPFLGIDSEGYFVAKIPFSQNPWTIIGFLEEAKSFYKSLMIRRAKEIEEKSKILKPTHGGKWPYNWKNKFRR